LTDILVRELSRAEGPAPEPHFLALGRALLEGHRVRALFMHCLIENGAMMHLARRQEMEIVAQSGEADAWLRLLPADASSHFGEVFAQRVALFDYALKRGRSWLGPGR
jgi:hypothetical protein